MTLPTIAYSGNAGTYLVDATVAIVCSASDAPSGLASLPARASDGPAHAFPVGINSFSAIAMDKSGIPARPRPPSPSRLRPAASAGDQAIRPDLGSRPSPAAVATCHRRPASERSLPEGRGDRAGAQAVQKTASIVSYNSPATALVTAGWLTQAQGTMLKTGPGSSAPNADRQRPSPAIASTTVSRAKYARRGSAWRC